VKILTSDNQSLNVNHLPDQGVDLNFCVLDYSDSKNIDYYWHPLVFLESFVSPSVDLQIGPFQCQMPLDWYLVIGDPEIGDLEIVSLLYLMDKDFQAFCFNPLTGYIPKFHTVEVINVWPDVKWFCPKLKTANILAVPLQDGHDPTCAFFVKDLSKIPEILDIKHLF